MPAWDRQGRCGPDHRPEEAAASASTERRVLYVCITTNTVTITVTTIIIISSIIDAAAKEPIVLEPSKHANEARRVGPYHRPTQGVR